MEFPITGRADIPALPDPIQRKRFAAARGQKH
jgi:hypothetical protein